MLWQLEFQYLSRVERFKGIKEIIMKCSKVFSLSLLALFSSASFAEPAVMISDFRCTLFDGDGGFFSTNDTKVVNSNNGKGGQINFKCHASGVPNSTGTAVHYDFESTGQRCNTLFGSTTDWKEVVDSEGNAQLTCKIHVKGNS